MAYKHVLALNPKPDGSHAVMDLFPPAGIEYIAANISDFVGKVTLLDLRAEKKYQNPEKLCDLIRNENVDLLCISITWRSGFEKICELICRLPAGITTVVGGHKATEEVEELFRKCPNIDLIVRGEGEDTIREIVQGVPIEDIAGLSYRKNGNPVHNANRPLPDLTHLVFPDRSLRKQEYRWKKNGIRLLNKTFDAIQTARGCPFNCKFCTFSLNPLGQKRKYTERPLDSVIEELKTVSAEVVMFSDDNFFANPRRCEELCDRIIESGIKKTYVVQARIEVARHPALLEKAKKVGIRMFLVGIESPHDWILKQINKGFTQQKLRDAFKILNAYDFYIHGYFIYGNIGETEEEMVYIAQFARELGLDSISFQKLRIEKFSPLQEIVDKTPGYHYNSIGDPVYSDRYDLVELKRIRNRIRSEFYTAQQLRHILGKFRRLGLANKTDVLLAILKIPALVYTLAKREVEKMQVARARRAASR